MKLSVTSIPALVVQIASAHARLALNFSRMAAYFQAVFFYFRYSIALWACEKWFQVLKVGISIMEKLKKLRDSAIGFISLYLKGPS